MPIELKVPSVGESITEVIIGTWMKKEGDAVGVDSIILGAIDAVIDDRGRVGITRTVAVAVAAAKTELSNFKASALAADLHVDRVSIGTAIAIVVSIAEAFPVTEAQRRRQLSRRFRIGTVIIWGAVYVADIRQQVVTDEGVAAVENLDTVVLRVVNNVANDLYIIEVVGRFIRDAAGCPKDIRI